MSKKGQQFDWILWLIIILIAAVLVITIYYLWAGKLSTTLNPFGL